MGNETSNNRYATNDGHNPNSNRRNTRNANTSNTPGASDWDLGSIVLAAGAAAVGVYAGSKLLSTENVPVRETKTIQDNLPRRYFGWYECSKCGNKWTSARSWEGKGQQCKRCNSKRYNYPYKQEPLEKRNKEHKDSDKEHPQELCEMCIELGYSCVLLG
ncbi:zygote arrest protein 2.L-like [Artemia franciscana]|uniref:zygote arrest protein 2.L-like n=1 Tax=Artemia franciscana TaxID=6661 RepID=UPI0032D9D61D